MSNLLRTAGVHEWRVRSQGGVVTEALRLSDRTDLINEIIARSIIELAKAGQRDPDLMCEGALRSFREQRGSGDDHPFPPLPGSD